MSGNWLAQLAPDRAPAAVGWWPPAPGWWALALILVVLAVALAAAAKWWRDPRRRLRRAALRELKSIRASAVTGSAAARAVENLLRRYAIALYGRKRVARLAGGAWLAFASAAGAPRLAGETGRSLLAAAFGERSQDDPEPWLTAAAEFIRAARPEAQRLAP
ncbi:MAG TPA: DUF4381 domain-containing protein [Steroidobacteraceae bacterium]|nr:DUF4381 domain-containing protein [Steroidobacteraceae bacterium]